MPILSASGNKSNSERATWLGSSGSAGGVASPMSIVVSAGGGASSVSFIFCAGGGVSSVSIFFCNVLCSC